MTRLRSTGPLLIVLLATACSTTPTGPSVLVLPGSGKSYDQFRAEEARCRQRAASELQQATDHGPVTAQGRYDMVYIQCMYADGNQVPVAGRGWRSPSTDVPPPSVPPPPTGTPPPPPPSPAK